MEELSEKIDLVLASVAAQVNAAPVLDDKRGKRILTVKLKDGTQEEVEITADMSLGIGDDRDKLVEQMKMRGMDVADVELPKGIQHKDVLQWCEALDQALMKAWAQRVDLVDYVEQACRCGEGLMNQKQYSVAYIELYSRFTDKLTELKATVVAMCAGNSPAKIRGAASVIRFYLGRCMSLYQLTIHRDENARRPDTIETLRDVLRDIVAAVKFGNDFDEPMREEIYWAMYNASLLAMRVSRWLRVRGFGGYCVPSLWWLAQSMNTCLPLMAVHLIPFRSRFFQELAYCAESAQQLGEAVRICDTAIEHFSAAQKLETMLPPVPEETQQIFDTALARFRILKIKYDFWLGKIPDVGKVTTMAQEFAPSPSQVVSCLLEVLTLQHGLPEGFGVAGKDSEPTPQRADAGAPEVTTFSYAAVQAKQADIIEAILAIAMPHLEKAEAATRALEEFIAQRQAFEKAEDEMAKADDAGEDAAPDSVSVSQEQKEERTAPVRPDEAQLEELGFGSGGSAHSSEAVLPLSAHVMLMRMCLRHEMENSETKLQGTFKRLERYLAIRVRYRNFLCPPLVDIDILVSPESQRDSIALPEKYECLTEDLNALSLHNRQRGDESGRALAATGKFKGRHVYVVGQRYDAWESWSPEYPAAIKRICDVRVVFDTANAAGSTKAVGFFDTWPEEVGGNAAQPWMGPYATRHAEDSTGFDHVHETTRLKGALFQHVAGYLTQKRLQLPIDPHPGAAAREAVPYIVFRVYDERALWVMDGQAEKPQTPAGVEADEATLLPADVDPDAKEAEPEVSLPPWSPLLDTVSMSAPSITDLSIFVTKYLHAPVPSARFNATIKVDLRQTPREHLGRPFNSYIFLCAAVNAPSNAMITRQSCVLRALHELHVSSLGPPPDTAVAGGEQEADQPEAAWQRPQILDQLLAMAECLDRMVAGPCGELFMLDIADFLEDVCAHIFLKWIWPKLQSIQLMLKQHELRERIMSENEMKENAEWSLVFRRLLPLLLQILEDVCTVDAVTLGSAAYALSKLFMKENDAQSGQRELGKAIACLEDDIAQSFILGPQPQLDRPVAAAVSYDPASVRPPGFALFDDAAGTTSEGNNASMKKDRATLVIQGHSHIEQNRLCLLTCLYERWIDCSLKAHLKNVGSTIRRARRPNESSDEGGTGAGTSGSNSTRIALSNQEVGVLARLGENPYLRCLFFVAVARRRPDVAETALGKACQEVDAAVAQEQQLWAFCERELVRQQGVLRGEQQFCSEFRRASKQQRPRAHPAIPYGRSPGAIRLRVPPLINSPKPPLLAATPDLHPPRKEYDPATQSEELHKAAGPPVLTCGVFGKAAGTGTAVSDMHRELPGTGLRRPGYDFVEVTNLKPNTNYTFATMYYEGFDTTCPAASQISETSPPIGSYYPLPLTLLRIEICKAALAAGPSCSGAWKQNWRALFETFCERTSPAEELDAGGLRTFKLRLDVADRTPPAILAAFAELVLARNSDAIGEKHGEACPSTRSGQQAVLRGASEYLIAVDCACRANDSHLTFRGVSITLTLISSLLHYRTKPQVLFVLLTKCATSLGVVEPAQQQSPWFARARIMVTYLLHETTVLCVQLQQVAALSQQLEGDAAARHDADALAEGEVSIVANHRALEQTIELALLGSIGLPHAEGKAKVLMRDRDNLEDLLRLLREFSERNYAAVAKDAAQLVLQQEEHHPFIVSLLRSSATRAWVKGGIEEVLAEVLSKHQSCEALDSFLATARKSFIDYGFMLRALPPHRILPTVEPGDSVEGAGAEADGADGGADSGGKPAEAGAADNGGEGAAGGADEPPEQDPLDLLAEREDSVSLSQLELIQAAPVLHELCSMTFHCHDISRFKFFDLQQIVPPDPTDEDALDATDQSLNCDGTLPNAGDGQGEGAEDMEEWELQELEKRKNRARAFELLQKLLRLLVRAAAYASARQAIHMLQKVLIVAMNALLIVGPSPAECVPPGPKSNPQDTNPDEFVGAPPAPKKEGEDPTTPREQGDQPPAEENDLWLNLALIAELAVGAVARLKEESTHKQPPSAPARQGGRNERTAAVLEGCDEEAHVIADAIKASKAMEAADEELHDLWFEKMPELDITSVAKIVGFAVLCLYHMRRWNNVIILCRNFNDATCSVLAMTFLPLMIGAQREVCKISTVAASNTTRYMLEAKATFETQQKGLSRKWLRQLALQGELSEPETLFKKQSEYYADILQRQQRLIDAWKKLLGAQEGTLSLLGRAVPAAVEQLRKSRILLAEFLQDRQAFNIEVPRGTISEGERTGRERGLRLAAMALVSAYRKSVELLRKRNMTDQVVQALHELGNLQWLEGDASGAQTSWSDALDAAYQYVYSIKNCQKCIQTAVTAPQNAARAEIMLLTVVILAKHARLTMPSDASAHLNAALFASAIVEAVLTSSLPHPSHRASFSPDRYRMRGVFFGLRESRTLLPPNSVHGGLDGMTFLSALTFFVTTLHVMDYQPARCLPFCALHNYVATDICRNRACAIEGRLLMVRSLLRCRDLAAAWLALYAVARGHDLPQQLLVRRTLDQTIVEAQDIEKAAPYRNHEEPYSDNNIQAVSALIELALPSPSADPAEEIGDHIPRMFRIVQAEYLVCVCSYVRVYEKLGDPHEKQRLQWLEKAEAVLGTLWKEVTGNDDDVDGWSTSVNQAEQERHMSKKAGDAQKGSSKGAEPTMAKPCQEFSKSDGSFCSHVRLLRAWIWELRGDLGRAVVEVQYAMHFVHLLATSGVKQGNDCGISGGGGGSRFRAHTGMKSWMMLRRRIVHLLMGQGRLDAANAHIEQGLQECQATHDLVTQIDLLAAKVRADVLSGRILEMRGAKQVGAIPIAKHCISVASRLPVATKSAVHVQLMLCSVLEQNPAMQDVRPPDVDSMDCQFDVIAPNDRIRMEAEGNLIISPIAKDLLSQSKAPDAKQPQASASLKEYRERQNRLADRIVQCIQDLDSLLEVQGFELHSYDMNSLLHFGDCGDRDAQPQLPLLPPLSSAFRERPASDSRGPPNIYIELMPLRLHCELRLAALRLEVGDMEAACTLLEQAESRMTRCVYLLPWLYVQFCILKLRWRRLSHQLGVAPTSAPPGAPNDVWYRDVRAFADGICPPTSSPIFRTFVKRARTPSLTDDTEWAFRPQENKGERLSQYLQELLQVLHVATHEGGHDYMQVFALLREGLEEVLRIKVEGDMESPGAFDQIHALFSCLIAVADARRALHFEPPGAAAGEREDPAPGKGGGKGAKGAKEEKGAKQDPVEVASLPPRVALDIQRHMKRQAFEGGLAYSAAALEASQKSVLFRTVTKHILAIQRECEMFASIFHSERHLCDQLHMALRQCSDAYSKKVLDEAHLKSIGAPSETPSKGDVIIHWVQADITLGAQSPRECCAYLALACPSGDDAAAAARPLLARCNDVHYSGLRQLWDGICADLEHIKPAASVTAEYVAQRLGQVARSFRGVARSSESAEQGDAELDEATKALLGNLARGGDDDAAAADDAEQPAEPQLLDSSSVQELLQALIRLLDRSSHAVRVAHPALGAFLRAVLLPCSVTRCTEGAR